MQSRGYMKRIRVFIDDNGIAMFEYRSPHELTDIEVEGAMLLPFSSIQEIFEEMIVIVDNEYAMSEEEWTLRVFYRPCNFRANAVN